MFSKGLTLIMACALLLPVVNVSAQEGGKNLPELVISYTDDGVSVTPSEVPAGLTRIVMENPGKKIGGSPITRLKDGYTREDLMAAVSSDDPMDEMMLLEWYGGLSVAPESTASITLELVPGLYIVPQDSDNIGTFTVVEGNMDAEVEKPASDVELAMVDFGYELPQNLAAGEQVWHISNEGEQFHEFFLVPVDADATLEDAADVIRAIGSPSDVMAGTSPIDVRLVFGPMSPGLEAWITVDLEPGTYALGSLLPDITSSPDAPMLQLEQGMLTIFTVEE